MKLKCNTCPLLTPNDILTLRGDPVAKRIEYGGNGSASALEEWTYYNTRTNTKESYVFKNGQLIGYKKK